MSSKKKEEEWIPFKFKGDTTKNHHECASVVFGYIVDYGNGFCNDKFVMWRRVYWNYRCIWAWNYCTGWQKPRWLRGHMHKHREKYLWIKTKLKKPEIKLLYNPPGYKMPP